MMSTLYVTFIYLLILRPQFVLGNHWIHNEKINSSYFVKTGLLEMTFTEAEAHCLSIGGHLTSIHSKEENIYVENLVNKFVGESSKTSIWADSLLIGAHRNNTAWQYTDGTQFDYANWAQQEPSNAGGHEDCLLILGSKTIYQGKRRYEWNDIECNFKFHSHVCKKPGGINGYSKDVEIQNKPPSCEANSIAIRRSAIALEITILIFLAIIIFAGYHFARRYRVAVQRLEKLTKLHQIHYDDGFPIPEPQTVIISEEMYHEHCSLSSD